MDKELLIKRIESLERKIEQQEERLNRLEEDKTKKDYQPIWPRLKKEYQPDVQRSTKEKNNISFLDEINHRC